MIHNFRKREKLKPLVDVAIGATVPAGCKEHAIYAESPENDKCVSDVEGACPNIKNCKMARKNEKQLFDAGFKTRPTQLGFFLMPREYREMLNLPPRPTQIPNIVVISDHDAELYGLREPFEALMRYPVLDYYLAWWKATECVCRGDGQKLNCTRFRRSMSIT